MKQNVIHQFYKHAISVCRKINIRHNPSKDQFDNMHLFYNPHITSGTDILKPDKACTFSNILKIKDLAFQASAGHRRKVFKVTETVSLFHKFDVTDLRR